MRSVCKWQVWLMQYQFVVVLIFTVSVTAKSKVACEPVATSNCSCKLDNNGGTYDLEGIVGNTIIPRFSVPGGENVTYFYDPCRVFSREDCKDVAACKLDTNLIPSEVTIAVFDDLVYDYDDTQGKQLTIRYTNGGNSLITTTVELLCNIDEKDPVLEVTATSPAEYLFSLTSSYICNQPIPPPQVAGISFGTFLCISIPVIFFCYFSFGFVYLFFIKHESWRNAIPHHEFWCGLPGLVKEGASYTWTSITGKCGASPSSYEQI